MTNNSKGVSGQTQMNNATNTEVVVKVDDIELSSIHKNSKSDEVGEAQDKNKDESYKNMLLVED